MDAQVAERLVSIPRLDASNAPSRKCKICGANAHIFDVVDFAKFCDANPYAFGISGIPVVYYRCPSCEFLFTDFCDDWRPADFTRYIYNDEYIMVDPDYKGARPKRSAQFMRSVLKGCEALRVLDYGSGSGIFADEMKLLGFYNIVSYDPFSTPDPPAGVFDIITSFEVIEHSSDPISTISDMARLLSSRGAIFLSQTLQPDNIMDVRGRWWYVAPRNGHISTYSDYTLQTIAKKFNLRYHRGHFNYAFSRDPLGAELRAPLANIGPLVESIILAAPTEVSFIEPTPWHELEKQGLSLFRWSSQDTLTWKGRTSDACILSITIPYLMELVEGFAQSSRLWLDGQELTIRLIGNSIVADAPFRDPGAYEVTLQTPELTSPKILKNVPDHRLLGLAIKVV